MPAGPGFRAAGDLDTTDFEDLSLPCSGGGAMVLSGTLTLDLPAAGDIDPGAIDPNDVDADFDPLDDGDLDMSVSFEYTVDFDGCTGGGVVIDGGITWSLATAFDGDSRGRRRRRGGLDRRRSGRLRRRRLRLRGRRPRRLTREALDVRPWCSARMYAVARQPTSMLGALRADTGVNGIADVSAIRTLARPDDDHLARPRQVRAARPARRVAKKTTTGCRSGEGRRVGRQESTTMPDLTQFPVSLTFVALCAGSLFFLVTWIGALRGKTGILRGDAGHPDLFKRMRIHGNFVENAPLVALVMIAAEGLGVGSTWLWACVIAFFVGRVYHSVRYDAKDRAVGLVLTTLPALGLSLHVVAVLATA